MRYFAEIFVLHYILIKLEQKINQSQEYAFKIKLYYDDQKSILDEQYTPE